MVPSANEGEQERVELSRRSGGYIPNPYRSPERIAEAPLNQPLAAGGRQLLMLSKDLPGRTDKEWELNMVRRFRLFRKAPSPLRRRPLLRPGRGDRLRSGYFHGILKQF